MLLASSPTAMAALETYDFTFASSGMDATGTITVDNGVAQSGSINVTGVPLEASPTTLISAAGSLLPANGATDAGNHDGDVITYDNVVNLSNDPILDSYGLGFGSGQYQDSVHYSTVINLFGNSPDSYRLFVGEAQLDSIGNVIGDAQWVYASNDGSLTLAAVPEPATYGAIGGVVMLLVSLGSQLRRKLA